MSISPDVQERLKQLAQQTKREVFLFREIEEWLFESLGWIQIQPKRILNISADVQHSTENLQKSYPEAEIMSVDIAEFSAPLAIEPVNLVFSNLCLPWCDDMELFFKTVAAVLKPEGLLIFSTLGAATRLFNSIGFPDFHDVGDALMRHGLRDPVVESELLPIEYRAVDTCRRECADLGLDFFDDFSVEFSAPVHFQLDIVLGHAWRAPTASNEFTIHFKR